MTASAKTSKTHPLRIASVGVPSASGKIGATFAPGKWDSAAATGPWRRDLGLDLGALAGWGARLVLMLLESDEMARLGIPNLGDEVRRRNRPWLHMPIRDADTPSPGFEARWPAERARLRSLLTAGNNVLIHCRGGLGRAGMVAARLQVEMDTDLSTKLRTLSIVIAAK